ncbi:MAG: excinuclease ABC subunit C [Candidatus Puniceispirillum sp.]|nr:excinuclease ABC subunit C [Candidatus Puniceispirillum sp.]
MTQDVEPTLFSTGARIIAEYVKVLPDAPGVYRMLDERGTVLYVGKANSLKKRVTNYTQVGRLCVRIQRMVAATKTMEFVTTPTQTQALLLEANFIKKFKPQYNILLKDDKSFSYLEITAHPFPRLTKHRGALTTKSQYFGPFASTQSVYASLETLHKAFGLRGCTDSFFAGRKRVCLEYHIKRCSGPCVGMISQEDYAISVAQAVSFLKGKDTSLQAEIASQMQAASLKQDYERARVLRDQLRALTNLQQQQSVHIQNLADADIFAFHQKGPLTVVQVFFYRMGRNYGSVSLFPQRMDEEDSLPQAVATFLALFYADKTPPQEIYSNIVPGPQDTQALEEALSHLAGKRVSVSAPKRGPKALVVEEALKNAKEALARKESHATSFRKHLGALAKRLGIGDLQRVELYDNSHIQGKHRIGAMVVVSPQGLEKASYRTFKIREAELPQGGDDFAMMREVLTRRLSGSTVKEAGLPDLIILDGGAGQVSAGHDVLEALSLDIPLLGIAKGPERNAGRETFHRKGHDPFSLEDDPELLFFLQRIRDEVHRFAIGTHRKGRDKNMLRSRLDDLPGVGPKRKKALLAHFGSAVAVQDATPKDIARVDGISDTLAQQIYDYLHG